MNRRVVLLELAEKAFEVISQYDGNPRDIISKILIGTPSAAVRFVEKLTTKVCQRPVPVFNVRQLPQAGFASWLVISAPGVPGGIAVFPQQLSKWSYNRGPNCPPWQVMYARSVVHEFSHIIATKEVLQSRVKVIDGKEFALPADENAEEKAWILTFILMGLAAGDYAVFSRVTPPYSDDTPSLLI